MQVDLNTPRARNLALALLAMTQFVVVIDSSIVTVAIPSMGRALHMSQDQLTWVINAYVLAFGGFLLLGGRLADLLGRRRVFICGIALFTAASLIGGLAHNQSLLFAARGIQGLGAALAAPAALSIITTTFEGTERNRALAVWGAVAGAGGAAGVLLGGALTEYLGWPWVLFVNVPIGAFILWQAPLRLPVARDSKVDRGFDFLGAIVITGATGLIVYTIVGAPDAGWGSPATLGCGAGGLLLLGLFVAIEARTARPLIPFAVFSLRTLRGANIVGLLIGMALVSMFFTTTLYLQQVLGLSALSAGLAFLPLSLSIIGAAAAASPLVTRFGFKPVLILALLFVAAGLLWFSRISPEGSYTSDVLGPSILSGLGLGLSFVPITIAAVARVDHPRAGLASGLINASQQIGGALGLAIVVSVASSVSSGVGVLGGISVKPALTQGFSSAYLVAAGIAILGTILASTLISSRDSRELATAARQVEGTRLN